MTALERAKSRADRLLLDLSRALSSGSVPLIEKAAIQYALACQAVGYEEGYEYAKGPMELSEDLIAKLDGAERVS